MCPTSAPIWREQEILWLQIQWLLGCYCLNQSCAAGFLSLEPLKKVSRRKSKKWLNKLPSTLKGSEACQI